MTISVTEQRSCRQWLGIYLRGMVMGVAELVPGVSGGTIAFVTGIYDELVHTLANLKPGALSAFRQGPIAGAQIIWRERNLTFLLILGVGMLSSVVLLANLLAAALADFRPVVWGFFLGIIVLSIWLLGRGLPKVALLRMVPLGILAGLLLTALEPFAGSETPLVFFIAGAIAVSAWLLPAISGSFMLLTLGLYEPVIGAVAAPDWEVLAVFGAGCVLGLLLFANALSHALRRWRAPLLSFLTGFMMGASVQLWPWQLAGERLLPAEYGVLSGEPAFLPATLVSLVLGALSIWLLSRFEP